MGVAAMVLGIIAILLACVPYCNYIGFILAIVGLILGIVDAAKKSKTGESKGMAVTGIVLSTITLVISIVWIVLLICGFTLSAIPALY